jgi:hypothetical protein
MFTGQRIEPEASDTNAEWMCGDGYLWIYEPSTTQGSELLQISPTSGAVLDAIAMPMISRLLMAANADGLCSSPRSRVAGRATQHASASTPSRAQLIYAEARRRC